ncbi:MAG: transposase [Bacteroidales bacterium]|jgi:transposase|nr:transposase [Bacteroidales bacterium]
MKKTKSHYDRSFKEQAVQLSYERKNISATARELGLDYKLLLRWRKEFETFSAASFQGKGVVRQSAEQAEIQRLNKLLEIQRKENEILKKAIGIISESDR